MQRLVIGLTSLLTLAGGLVVAGYLLIFAASADRAAQAVPAGTAIYGTIYLQPSTGQKTNLAALLSQVPGFSDAAALDTKLHQIAARLLSDAGLDYEGDLRPWLGHQLAVAIDPHGTDPAAARVLLLVAVKDQAAADAAIDRIARGERLIGSVEPYQGVEVMVAPDASWALLEDLLLVGADAPTVHAALDADADRAPSLADETGFRAAIRRLPADHLAAIYVDLEDLAELGGAGDQLGGYSPASLALVAEPHGLRLAGSAPFEADLAPPAAREAFALASEPSSLADWMPVDTQAELVIFGLSQALRAAEEQLGSGAAAGEVADAINQLRAVAALGLGIDVEADLLPLFDRETALAAAGFGGATPSVQLLLRPSDPDAAGAALERMRDALRDRGSTSREREVDGVTLTTISVPDVGEVSYAMRDGVIVAALDPDLVAAALVANRDGETLGASARYRAAWELAGVRGGNEFWVDVAAIVDAAGDQLGVTGDARDILLEIGALAMTAPARDDRSEFHVVLTAR